MDLESKEGLYLLTNFIETSFSKYSYGQEIPPLTHKEIRTLLKTQLEMYGDHYDPLYRKLVNLATCYGLTTKQRLTILAILNRLLKIDIDRLVSLKNCPIFGEVDF